MGHSVNIPHLERLVTRQLRVYEQEARAPREVPHPSHTLIHIEREEGSGAEALARQLARTLGWQLARSGRGLDLFEPSVDPRNCDDRLRVRLVSPLDQRAQRVAQRLGWSTLRARRWLLESHEDPRAGDPHAYDLVLNVEHATPQELEAIVLAALAARRTAALRAARSIGEQRPAGGQARGPR